MCIQLDATGERPQSVSLQTEDALSALLWLYRRLPRGYGRQEHIERAITALAKQAGEEVGEFLEEREHLIQRNVKEGK